MPAGCTTRLIFSASFVFAFTLFGCSEDGPGSGKDPNLVAGKNDGGAGTGDGASAGGDGASSSGGDGAVSADGSGGGNDGSGGGNDGAAGGNDGGTGGGCGPVEICGNGLDDDCNNAVDDSCPCSPGATQACYGGAPSEAGRGVCTYGTQSCTLGSDFGQWGPCTGDGRPQPVVCGGNQDWRCDGIIDEGCGCPVGERRDCYDGPAGTAGVGICRAGSQSCVATATSASWGACAGQVLPAAVNACDGQDNLCNGMPYSGCSCTPGESRPCYDGPPGTENVGLCIPGSQSCQIVNDVPTWGACTGEVIPAPNTCDGVDRMCTGNPNSGGCGCVVGTSRPCYDGAPGTAGVGVCVGGNQTCETGPGGAGSVWGMCNGQVIPTPNTCDGIDRMCDGMPLAGCNCVVGTTRPCYDGPGNTRGIGLCHDGSQTCVAVGAGSDWDPTCNNQALPAAAEICGNGGDDNCNGTPEEGCGPQIQCPADTTTLAGTAIALSANASSPTGIAGYSWTIVNAPTGGVGTPNQWTPPSVNAQTESFLPFIVGVYTIQITAIDNGGQQASCQMQVTALGHGLRVQLSWDGAGDVDLHLHAPNTVTPWFRGSSDDCFYANLRPIWDGGSPAAAGGNPSLDFDNTTANGPENTRIDVAQLGVPYTIAVHNYARAAGRVATVDVFCGGVSSPSQTFTSRPLQGNSSGDSSPNDFWKVAQVVFTSPTTCVITPINTYGPSSTYNSSF